MLVSFNLCEVDCLIPKEKKQNEKLNITVGDKISRQPQNPAPSAAKSPELGLAIV